MCVGDDEEAFVFGIICIWQECCRVKEAVCVYLWSNIYILYMVRKSSSNILLQSILDVEMVYLQVFWPHVLDGVEGKQLIVQVHNIDIQITMCSTRRGRRW